MALWYTSRLGVSRWVGTAERWSTHALGNKFGCAFLATATAASCWQPWPLDPFPPRHPIATRPTLLVDIPVRTSNYLVSLVSRSWAARPTYRHASESHTDLTARQRRCICSLYLLGSHLSQPYSPDPIFARSMRFAGLSSQNCIPTFSRVSYLSAIHTIVIHICKSKRCCKTGISLDRRMFDA